MRLNRQPCPTCSADTLHKGFTCLTCNTTKANPLDVGWEKYKRRVARLQAGKRRTGFDRLAYEHNERAKVREATQAAEGTRPQDRPGIGPKTRHVKRHMRTPVFRR